MRTRTILFLISFLLPWIVYSQVASDQRIKALDTFLNQLIDQDIYSGHYVLIARDQSVLISRGYGKKDIDGDSPPANNTLYRMASMSKPVTAVAILKVCEDNGISVDTPVATHLEMVPDKTVTIRQMLSHTSGWGSWWNAGELAEKYKELEPDKYEHLEKLVQDYLKFPQIEPAGDGWYYGYSTEVLVVWLEKVTGRKFTDYVATEIFEPIGMTNSGYTFPNDNRCAFFHEKDSLGQWKKKIEPHWDIEVGGAALVSTAEDYYKFARMLADGGVSDGKKILSQQMIDEMQSVVIGENGDVIPWQSGYGFGLGVSVRTNNELAKMGGTLGDFGWFGILGTSFWIDPTENIIGIVLSQRPYDGYKLAHEVKNLVYGE